MSVGRRYQWRRAAQKDESQAQRMKMRYQLFRSCLLPTHPEDYVDIGSNVFHFLIPFFWFHKPKSVDTQQRLLRTLLH
ncbi:MAG: hypothetical protein OXT67_13940 [Zetaproteobacteria bacterium]|nr:hypothetical protein [Zetaproteobacteria bacterium]